MRERVRVRERESERVSERGKTGFIGRGGQEKNIQVNFLHDSRFPRKNLIRTRVLVIQKLVSFEALDR